METTKEITGKPAKELPACPVVPVFRPVMPL